MRIVMTGATGMVGQELTSFLKGMHHEVIPMVRRSKGSGPEILWDPMQQELDPQLLEGCDVLIHLAGENIAARRWTPKQKDRILQSRKYGTELLAKTLARMSKPPRLWLSASAVGYYGPGEEIRTEAGPPGDDFLARVASIWEASAQPAIEAGVRVAFLRFATILSTRGGALAKMLLPFRLGLGGRLGSGTQPMSWVALPEIGPVVHHLMHETSIQGPVNVVAPEVVTQLDFARTLAHLLHRPAFLPLPAAVLRAIYGELADALLLKGRPVQPSVLLQSGYEFRFPLLRHTLEYLLRTRG